MNKQISINTQQFSAASQAAQKFVINCRGCGKTVDLVTFNEAGKIVGSNIDEIIKRVATGDIHIIVRPEALLICLDSLLAAEFVSLQKARFNASTRRNAAPKANC